MTFHPLDTWRFVKQFYLNVGMRGSFTRTTDAHMMLVDDNVYISSFYPLVYPLKNSLIFSKRSFVNL